MIKLHLTRYEGEDDKDKEEFEITLFDDASITEWADTFKLALKWITFGKDTIKSIFKKYEE